VLSSGRIDCWGSNEAGRLGNGTTEGSDTPVEVQGISNATQVSDGVTHACAVLSTGQADCWGYNKDGELGDSTKGSPSLTPVEVFGL
jgi:alpha-tubulin suppressor-like RCC1 family protein